LRGARPHDGARTIISNFSASPRFMLFLILLCFEHPKLSRDL
jgi:hypothetical protein